MDLTIKEFLKLLSIPFIFLIITLSSFLLWDIFNLPGSDELLTLVSSFFDSYGLWFVLLGAVFEAMFIVGNYFPGSVIIFLGVIVNIGNPIKSMIVVFLVSVGFIIAHIFNYFLGKFGWYKLFTKFGFKKLLDESQKKLEVYEVRTIFLSFFAPSLAAFISTAAGILKMDFLRFIITMVLSVVFWSSFWGLLVYNVGSEIIDIMFTPKFAIFLFFVWVILLLLVNFFRSKFKLLKKSII